MEKAFEHSLNRGAPLAAPTGAIVLALLLGYSPAAYAYIDPGTGGILIQGLIAGLAFIAAFWRRIRNFFVGRRRKPDAPSSDAD